MAIVFIEEVGAPIRVCSKQVTADRFGIASADINLSELAHPTDHYTLVAGALVELTDVITAAAVEAEDKWVEEQLASADKEVAKHDDGHGRTMSNPATWRAYRNALRDRVQVIEGARTVVGNRPVEPGE